MQISCPDRELASGVIVNLHHNSAQWGGDWGETGECHTSEVFFRESDGYQILSMC